MRWLDQVVNLNLVQQSPISCSIEVNFYTELLAHTLVPMAVVITLLAVCSFVSA
jgi:hypothetical protein